MAASLTGKEEDLLIGFKEEQVELFEEDRILLQVALTLR